MILTDEQRNRLITDCNKLFAWYLGYKYYGHNEASPTGRPGWQKERAHLKITHSYLCRSHNQLKFNADWNRMMWVVNKIESIEHPEYGRFSVEMGTVRCKIKSSNTTLLHHENGLFLKPLFMVDLDVNMKDRLEAVFFACVRFIQIMENLNDDNNPWDTTQAT